MRRVHRLRFRLWHTAHLRDLAVEVEVGWSAAGDQPRTATEGQILYRPLDENENAPLERNQISYMDKSPTQPRYEPGNVNTENIGHRRCPSNHRQRPFVEVAKGLLLPLPLYFSQDRLGCIGTSLHGNLSHSRQRFSFFIHR